MIRTQSLESQAISTVTSIKNNINRNTAPVAVPILKWTDEKIRLAYSERTRINSYKNTHRNQFRPKYVKRGFIYYAKLGQNIGSEQCGYRPVLVVQSKDGNATNNTVIVIPLTDFYDKNGRPKRLLGTHVEISDPSLSKRSIIKAEHLCNISKNRIVSRPLCDIGEKMKDVEEKMKIVLGIS